MKVYLDNAATTPLDPQVVEAMLPFMTEKFGNPSSTHSHGREAKSAIEMCRKRIADRLGCLPGEIYFTSGGTESDNTIIRCAVRDLGLTHAITSAIEHHAVLHTLEGLEKEGALKLSLVQIDARGHIDYDHLEQLVKENPGSLVSLMHANNEIGNVNDVERIGDLCAATGSFFHSDTVQAMCHFPIDLNDLGVHGVVCSAHKIHGPKGVGFMYIQKDKKIDPYITGGGQERNMRGGTENVIGIVGLTESFVIAHDEMYEQKEHILKLKRRMIEGLKNRIEGIAFNGDSESDRCLYTVLNVCLPPTVDQEMLLFKLDLEGISASGGSACNSGAAKGSHVLEALNVPSDRGSIRFSFSKFNTEGEIDYTLDRLETIVNTQ